MMLTYLQYPVSDSRTQFNDFRGILGYVFQITSSKDDLMEWDLHLAFSSVLDHTNNLRFPSTLNQLSPYGR